MLTAIVVVSNQGTVHYLKRDGDYDYSKAVVVRNLRQREAFPLRKELLPFLRGKGNKKKEQMFAYACTNAKICGMLNVVFKCSRFDCRLWR